MKKLMLLTAALSAAAFLFAQQSLLTPNDLMNYRLYPSKPIHSLQYVGRGRDIAFVRNDTLFVGPAAKPKVQLTLHQLNGVLVSAHRDTLRRMPRMHFDSDREVRFNLPDGLFAYNFVRRTLTHLSAFEDSYDNIDIAPLTHYVAHTEGNALVIDYLDARRQMGDSSEQHIVYGQSVHRNEFGINKGTFWSPRGSRLAFYRMDESMVADYPLVQTDARIAEAKPFKYPMAGMKSHEVTVGIYNTVTEQTVYLDSRADTSIAEREMYLTNISWSPDERYLYLAKLNRDQNHLWLECYDATTGQRVRTLFEETNARYVEPLHGLFFVPGHDDEFLWLSRRDGYRHIYHYRTDGTLLGQLTSGTYEVSDIVGFDANGRHVYYYSNQAHPMGSYAYSVALAGGDPTLLTPDHGTHSVVVSPNGKQIIDSYQSSEVPARIVVADAKGHRRATLYDAPNPLADYSMPTITTGSIKAADNTTDLYYRLVTPPNLDSSLRYPTIVYVYGGPHAQLVTDEWLAGANLYTLFLAQQGYVVFTIDNRGSEARGMEFESCTHRHLGEIELADQMQGVEFLKSLPFVDADRMGVEGWSFGGFMTITMKLAHPEIFKVACAGGPVIDWKWYEVMYGERYMDTPQQNAEGYSASSLISKADQLEGRLLVIHGAEDDVVMWQNSLQFIDACINAGRLVDYFVYPHHRHNVIGRDRLHLYYKMFDYYETYLK